MKQFILFMMLALSLSAKSQVTKVYFQASGLTCSMCSNAINKSLKTLDFIDKIDADVKNSTFELSFKPNSNVDFDKIRDRVESAGFSISSLFATVQFDNTTISEQPIKVGALSLVFVDSKQDTLNGETKIKVLNKGFVSNKEYKRASFPKSDDGVYHVTL